MVDEVVKQELVAHFFVVHGDADAAVRAMWSRCGRFLGADEPIPLTGLPVEFPDELPAAPTNGSVLVAARQDRAVDVQALLRREHEVLCLSVLLAARPGHSWSDFDQRLDVLLGEEPDPVMGQVRLFLGVLPPDAVEPFPNAFGTRSGLLVGETGATDDARVDRRFLVLVRKGGEKALSRWTWSDDGNAHMPPFARYLMHVAKIRDQLRLRARYPDTAELCRQVERSLARFDGTTPPPPTLRATVARMITTLRTLRKTVHVSWLNAESAVDEDFSGSGADPFSADRVLAARFGHELDDVVDYLTNYGQELREMSEIAAVPPAGTASEARSATRGASGNDARWPVVLAVADEWFPKLGGISTLNRSLCGALADARADVYCLVPSSTYEEREDAAALNVRLVDSVPVPGFTQRELLLNKPPLPDGLKVDVVIGHGRVTGHVAQVLVRGHFPDAIHLHLVHVNPDEVEWHKLDRGDDAGMRADERSKIEIEIAAAATRAVPVGPRLDEWMSREMSIEGRPAPVRLDPGFDVQDAPQRIVHPGVPRILLIGRAEDEAVKGIDIAAAALGESIRAAPGNTRWELVIRGVPDGATERLRNRVMSWIDHHRVEVTPRPYSSSRKDVEREYRAASLVIVPSRVEGFGLVGHEAIRAGTPLLISGRSGLGLLLEKDLDTRDSDKIVVPVVNNTTDDIRAWSHRISSAMHDLDANFAMAARVQKVMAAKRTWAMAAQSLLGLIVKGD